MSTPRIDVARLGLAVHEAGHAVVGVVHGAQLQRATISGRSGALSGCTEFSAASFQTGGPLVYRTHVTHADVCRD